MSNVLIIDDEIQICKSIQLILDFEGYHTDFATSGTDGLQKISSESFDLVLLDIQMPDMNGFEVLRNAKNEFPFLNIVIISAFGNIQNAIQATKLGAFDFLEKPIDRDKLLITVRNAVVQANLKKENEEMKKTFLEPGEIVGNSRALKNVLSLIEKVSQTDVRILITGENGTGKELVAKAIYKQSARKENPFIEVNCAAIPNELIESELFGHEKGSFTGAMQQRIGKFELANKGTIFLDEIGDMSLQAQAKVLRAIEDGKIQRVGGTKSIEVDVRIISATNKNLKKEIEEGNFREDLFHRLNVIPIWVPPLRERLEDIPLLVEHFAQDISRKHKKIFPTFSEDALAVFRNLHWAGNIRELHNIVERIIILVDKKVISKKDIEFLIPYEKPETVEMVDLSNSFQDFKGRAERAFIIKQLDANHWNISKTADSLNIQRSHLYNKMKKYNIEKGKA